MPLVKVKNPKPAKPWLKALRARVLVNASRRKAKAAFCPTGPGQGQDNSCSPKGGGVSEKAVAPALKSAKPVDKELQAAVKEMREGSGKALGGSGRSEALNQQLSKTENIGRAGLKTESAFVYDHNGKAFVSKQGDDNHVQFSSQEISLMQLQGKATLTHNHPNGSPLSVDDIGLAVHANLAEVRAFGLEDGKMVHYSFARPKDGWPDAFMMRMAVMRALSDSNLIEHSKATTAENVVVTGRQINQLWGMVADNIGAKYQRQYE